MSKERELLERALDRIDWVYPSDIALKDEIRAFLAAEPEADKCQHRIADARNPIVQSGYVCVDCHALFQAADHQPRPEPELNLSCKSVQKRLVKQWGYEWEPARKPMSDEELPNMGTTEYLAFAAGVRYAEKHHGIGNEE